MSRKNYIYIYLRQWLPLFETYSFQGAYATKDHMDELINRISLGRFSRAKVKTAPSPNIIMIARNILPMYTKLIPGWDSFALSDELCKV